MGADAIYLDHNATSPLLPAAAEAMAEAWRSGFANPASQHGPGRTARRGLEAARERIIHHLGGDPSGRSPDRLVFTSGGTEANTLALRGLLLPERGRLVVSEIEHPSIARTADALAGEGYHVDRLPPDGRGVVTPERLARLLSEGAKDVALVSVMLASNETGVVQPIGELAALCREAGVPMHTDAVQAVGKRPIDFRGLGVTALSFTAHKFHGPAGVGGLLLAPEATLRPQMWGGHQQAGLRPGTESWPLVAGMDVALGAALDEGERRWSRMQRLRDRLERGIVDSWPGATVLGANAERLPHATCIAFPRGDRQSLVMAYDLAGVACSSGSACASGSSEPSPTLLAMGLDKTLVAGAVRFGVGALTTEREIDQALQAIAGVNQRLCPDREAV